jgi:peptidoglycan/LPS O-acetylase OafA/YrhL
LTKNRLVFVDALRGLAALLVVFHHSVTQFHATMARLEQWPAWIAATVYNIADLNNFAVMLFFMLSGFSIRLSIEGDAKIRCGDASSYAFRRIKRIEPLYLIALVFSGLCVLIFDVPVAADSIRPINLLGNLLFLQTGAAVPGHWFIPFAENGPLWSLSFEISYYLLFPILLKFAPSDNRRVIAAWAVTVLGVAANAVVPNPIAQFASHFIVWYYGVVIADMYLKRDVWLPLAMATVALLLLTPLRLMKVSTTLSEIWVGLTLVTIVVLGSRLRWGGNISAPKLAHQVLAALAWVGGFSYGLYLLHFPLLAGMSHRFGDAPVILVVAVAGSLTMAWTAEKAVKPLRIRWLALRLGVKEAHPG